MLSQKLALDSRETGSRVLVALSSRLSACLNLSCAIRSAVSARLAESLLAAILVLESTRDSVSRVLARKQQGAASGV